MPGEGSAIWHSGVLRLFKGRWAKGGDIRLVGNAASPAADRFNGTKGIIDMPVTAG